MPLAWKAICLPTDFSDASRPAARMAAELAAHFGAELLLIFVQVPPAIGYGDLPMPQSLLDEMDAQARQLLEEWKREVEALGARTRTTMLFGASAFDEIVRFAAQNRADLIVMGTHGRTALTHVLLGSVAERVVRHAACPVLTVRPTQPLSAS